MTRAARTVAKEIADFIERNPVCLTAPGEGLFYELPKTTAQRWLLLLCPPRKRKVRSPKLAKVKRTRRTGTSWAKELDPLCKEIVWARDKGACRRCGKSAGLRDWCHVYSRGIHSTRWDLDNVFLGCRGCHMNFWHKRPLDAAAWWKREIGAARYQALTLKANPRGPVNYEAVKEYLLQEQKKLGVAEKA